MFFRRFFRFALIVILFLGMIGLIRTAGYRSGWSAGYTYGQSVEGVPNENVPDGPFNRGLSPARGIFSLFWWGVAAFFKFWFFVFIIGMIFKLLFWGRRGHHRGHHKERPFGHWKGGGRWGDWQDQGHRRSEKGHDYKGPRPPWFDDSDGEPVMKA
jgi:hypothetical protein